MDARVIGRALRVPALAILTALLAGAFVMVVSDPETLSAFRDGDVGGGLASGWDVVSAAYRALFRSSLGSRNAIGETLVFTTPLLFAGLSFSLSFQAGLFNIGAEGQIIAGTVWAGWVGFTFDLPAVIHLPLALVAAFIGGALWGSIAGILKAKTGAHEVISTIMLNWIALRVLDWLLKTETFLRPGRQDPISKRVASTAELPTLLPGTRASVGFLLALAAAYAVWWLLYRSTIGFEFRTVGANQHAARYAGISVAGVWTMSMVIAGGLAGVGGATQLLGVQQSITGGFAGVGFDAIALALLGRTHPAGVIAASFMFGILRAGATGMQAATAVPVDIIVVIQALVILFVAAPALIQAMYRVKDTGPDVKVAVSWGA